MASTPGKTGKHAWVFDLFMFLFGAALLGLGIYLAWDSVDLYIQNITIPGAPNKIFWAVAVYCGIVSGAFCLVICLLGCCGVRSDNRCMLNTYLALVVICVILEIGATVLAILFNHQVLPGSESQFQTSIQTNYTDPDAISSGNPSTSYSWNVVQSEWQCCGSESYTDYWNSTFSKTTGYKVPYECCTRYAGVPTSNLSQANVVNYTACQMEATTTNGPYTYLYNEGCYTKSTSWVNSHSIYLAGTCFGVAFLQGFWLALLFCFALGQEGEKSHPVTLIQYVTSPAL